MADKPPNKKKRGQRGPGKSVQRKLAEANDRCMLELVRKGRPMIGAGGVVLTDENGKVLYAPPSGADLRAIVSRLAQIGSNPDGVSGQALLDAANARAKAGLLDLRKLDPRGDES